MNLKTIINKISNFFSSPKSSAAAPTVVVTKPAIEIPADASGINWLEWTNQAMLISGSFEGRGTDWGNPVPNFDGAGLTCGLLGFTWKWNNQPPMVLKFINLYGVAELVKLMPQCGQAYADAASKGEIEGGKIVGAWTSNPNTVHAFLKEPCKSELRSFWSDERMKKIQVEKAWEMMGAWAKYQALFAQKYFGMSLPLFQDFAYYFDQAVLNGQSHCISLDQAEHSSLTTVMTFCNTAGGFNKDDLHKNAGLWNTLLKTASKHDVVMFKAAYLRARFSKNDFQSTTMCRRATLALGQGYVNGSLRTYHWLV